MQLNLKIISLIVNLPLEDSQLHFVLNKQRLDSLRRDFNYEPTGDYVLMPQFALIELSQTQIIFQVENFQDQNTLNLYVMAISNSNSKTVLLGFVVVDISKFVNSMFQKREQIFYQQSLLGVENQKGTVSFKIYAIQDNFSSSQCVSESGSFDKEQTCSSDSYDAHLKQLNKTFQQEDTEVLNCELRKFIEVSHKINEYQQNIILQEVDLEDNEGNEEDQILKSDEKILTYDKFPLKKHEKKNLKKAEQRDIEIRTRLLLQKLQIERYLHVLQQSDLFMLKIEQRMMRGQID